MKGLILKDFYNLKKQGMVILVIFIFYAVFAVVGMVTNKPDSIFGMINVYLSILSVLLPMSAMAYDEKTKWDKYALTMAVTRTDIVTSKYILGLILASACLIINILIGTILNSEEIKSSISILSMMVICISVILPFIYKFGVEKSRLIAILIFMVPTITIILISNIYSDITLSRFSNIIKILSSVLPYISLVMYVLSMLISIKIFSKKQLS